MMPFFAGCLEPDVRHALKLVPEVGVSIYDLEPTGSERASASSTPTTTLPPNYHEAFYGAVSRFLAIFIKARRRKGKAAAAGGNCTYSPLVLLVDDVQWSSGEDLTFLRRMMAESAVEWRNCMLIFAFRDDDGNESFMDSQLRDDLCTSLSVRCFPMQKPTVDHLKPFRQSFVVTSYKALGEKRHLRCS